jgi:excisionase family DNA binding protein
MQGERRMPARVQLTIDDLDGRSFATATEAAAILHLDPRTIRRGVANGEIPATRVGPAIRIPVSWLRAQAGER